MAKINKISGRMQRMLFAIPSGVVLARIKGALGLAPDEKNQRSPLSHPIDGIYGIETSGNLNFVELESGKSSDIYITAYGGSQPSIVRRILGLIPDTDKATFLDFGCGKGRVLAVATEFPFRDIIGVELAPALVPIARDNAEIMARQFPQRKPITVIEGDVLDIPLPDGPLVIFLFDPFYRPIMKKVVKNLEKAMNADKNRKIYLVYYNPVHGDLFDKSKYVKRYYAANVDFSPDEMGAGVAYHDTRDCVVVWQSCSQNMADAHPKADSSLRIVPPGYRAEVVG